MIEKIYIDKWVLVDFSINCFDPTMNNLLLLILFYALGHL